MKTKRKRILLLTTITLASGFAASLNAASYGNGSTQYSGYVNHPTAPQTWSAVHTATAWTGAAIEDAIDRATSSGGTVRLGSGTYWVSSRIDLKSHVRIEGNGEGSTTIKRNGSQKPDQLFYTANSTWRNLDFAKLTIHGNNAWSDLRAGHSSADIETSGIDIAGNNPSTYGDKIRLRDVAIIRCKNGFIGGGFTNTKIEYSNISQNGSDGTNSSLHHNVYMRRVGRLFFYKTDMRDSPRGAGMKFWGGTTATNSESKDMEINQSWVNDNATSNLEANGWKEGLFQNTQFKDSDGGGTSNSGVLLGTGTTGAYRIDVVNNDIRGSNNNGVRTESSGRSLNIQGNLCNSNGTNYDIGSPSWSTSCDYNTN